MRSPRYAIAVALLADLFFAQVLSLASPANAQVSLQAQITGPGEVANGSNFQDVLTLVNASNSTAFCPYVSINSTSGLSVSNSSFIGGSIDPGQSVQYNLSVSAASNGTSESIGGVVSFFEDSDCEPTGIMYSAPVAGLSIAIIQQGNVSIEMSSNAGTLEYTWLVVTDSSGGVVDESYWVPGCPTCNTTASLGLTAGQYQAYATGVVLNGSIEEVVYGQISFSAGQNAAVGIDLEPLI